MTRSKVGSKRELRPGVWQVRVSRGYRSDGGQRTASATVHGSERDADAKIAELLADMGRAPSLGDRQTLGDYYWTVFSPSRHRTCTHAHAQQCDSAFRCHIEPAFGDWDIGRITNNEIQAWVLTLPPQSAQNYVRVLRNVLNQAAFDHAIERSPMDGYRFRMPRGRDTTPGPVWGAGEVMEALSRPAFRRSRLFPLWCVMCGGGLSRSEALAIDWEDVRWQSATAMDGREHWTAYVSITAAYTSADGLKDPKNNRRYRTVPVPPLFADALRERVGTGPICQSERYAKGGNHATGHRMSPSYVPRVWKQMFGPGRELDGLPFVAINRMRATYATLMQGAGVDHTLINAMQGRASESRALYDNYLHPSDAFDVAARKVQRRVLGA